MQKHYFQSFLFCLFLIVGLGSCEDQAKTPDQAESDDQEVVDTPVGDPIFGQITKVEAVNRAKAYNDIYGAKKRYLSNGQDSFLLPRYFTVNSDAFRQLLKDEDGMLFASMAVINRKDQPDLKDTAVANLIFHDHRPESNGLLGDDDTKFIDFNTSCPIDCGDSYNHGGFNGAGVNAAEAKKRVKRYNDIYGTTPYYLKPATGSRNTNSVLLARYFSFNINDMEFLLERLNKSGHEFFTVTIGAQPEMKNDQPVPNAYVSDLIFHIGRPDVTGGLGSVVADFFDVTQPCPNFCPNITDL